MPGTLKSLMERRRAKNMKLKAMFSKVVAVLCIVTIFISSFHVSVFDSKASTETEKGYELVTLSDLTDNYEPGNVTAKTVFTKNSALTWAETVFEGEFEFYNTSGNQANMLLLGNTTNSRGLKVYLQNETTLRVRFQDKPGASARTKDVDITAENVQLEKFTNQKLKLKIQFDFKNYSTDGTTADVTAKITINDKYTTTLEQTAFQLVYMSRVVWLAATNDAPLYHNSQKIYDTVTLSDLTDNYEPGNVTAKTVFTKSSALTWAGTVFEGEFEFYNTSGNQANMLLLGNTTNSRGLKVYLQNETTLRVRFQDKPGASARTKDVDITAENVQLEKFTNQKLKLKIQFDFKNYSTDGTTADVTAKITINDKYTTTLEQTAFQLVYMSRVVWLAATNDAPLYHNSQAQGGEVTPPEEEEPEEEEEIDDTVLVASGTMVCKKTITETEASVAGEATSGSTTVTVEFSDGMLTTISSSKTVSGVETPEQHQAVASELTLETAPTFNFAATDENGELDLSIDAVKANYEDLDFVCEVL